MSHRTIRSVILVSIPTVLLSMAFVIATAVTLWAAPRDSSTYGPVAAPISQSTPTTDTVTTDEAGIEYIIQPGDSLYKISGQFYSEPGAYRQIVRPVNGSGSPTVQTYHLSALRSVTRQRPPLLCRHLRHPHQPPQ